MTSSETDVVEEYAHDCQIIREQRDRGEDLYHYEGPFGQVKAFENPGKARLYADVHTVMGGFREEKTGERGVPPSVARAREDIINCFGSTGRATRMAETIVVTGVLGGSASWIVDDLRDGYEVVAADLTLPDTIDVDGVTSRQST